MTITLRDAENLIASPGAEVRLAVGGSNPVAVRMSGNLGNLSIVNPWCFISVRRSIPQASGGTRRCEIQRSPVADESVLIMLPGFDRSIDQLWAVFAPIYSFAGASILFQLADDL